MTSLVPQSSRCLHLLTHSCGREADRQTEEVVVKIDRKTRDRERDRPENRKKKKKKKKKWLGLGKIGSLVSSLVPIEKEGMSKMVNFLICSYCLLVTDLFIFASWR